MLLNLSKIGKILKETNRLDTIKEFNNSIPIKVEVLKEINPITYKIKLGRKEVETKSYIPLEVGKKYLSIVKEKKGYIQLTNLKEYPKLLDLLEKIPLQKQIKLDKKEILHHITEAKTKDEFLFFANIFLALKENIHHLFFNENTNKGVMQYKLEKNRIKFYACFRFLGEIEGEIFSNKAIIFTEFKNIASLIEENRDKIDLEIEVKIKDILPLFEFKNHLINLKV